MELGFPTTRREIDAVVFDLDGTLWDTCATCAVAWNEVLARHEIPFREITAEDVRRVTGKPHEECIRETFRGVSEASLLTLIAETQTADNLAIRERGGMLYPGVVCGLTRLSEQYPLFIVSNCQAGYIESFLEWARLGACFVDFECWGRTGGSKANNLAALIARNNLRQPILVGDTPGDQAAARACGVPFVYVEYGFGVCDNAPRRFSAFTDLTAWLLRDS